MSAASDSAVVKFKDVYRGPRGAKGRWAAWFDSHPGAIPEPPGLQTSG